MPFEPAPPTPTPPVTWLLDLAVEAHVAIPAGESLDREAFFGWLWHQCGEDGLLGVFEGAIDTGEAATLGLVESPRVIDAATPPPDRDWVGRVALPSLTCWFATEEAARAAAARLADVVGCDVQGMRCEPYSGTDAEWQDTFAPLDVPGFGTIRPAWEEGTAEETPSGTTLFIEPGAGFGTGSHETTQLCLEALAAWQLDGGSLSRVLDFGSGSGILGIAAAVRGADRVDSIEIDPLVHDAIRANARRNGVDQRVCVAASLPSAACSYELVFANIVATVLLEHADALCGRVARGPQATACGCVVLSGLLADDIPAVAARYSHLLGVAPIQSTLGEWHCLRFMPPAGIAPGASPCR